MPTPTCAFCIIATSFAPSPMASVTDLVLVVTSSTTSAFWIGDTRQQITTLHEIHRSRKSRRKSQLRAYLSVLPSTINAALFSFRSV
uniref:Putative secreted protein n=1 Tax=Anopheles darlingi TaxID=43151 RepID=A0A2M4D107_ANODA